MSEQRFYQRPFGVKERPVPMAEVADTVHTSQIVQDHDTDAAYFRKLEESGVYLNPAQTEAVRYTEGPLLTLAGAGSGKTSVLVCRTGYLVSIQKVHPKNILLVTFTKKAAEEMKERIGGLPGLTEQMARSIQASTFHAFFLKLLRSRGYKQVILSNERYKQTIIKLILKEMGIVDAHEPETLLALFSYYKVNRMGTEQMPSKTTADKNVQSIFKRYEAWKRENNQWDFDDILCEAYQMLKQSPQLLQVLQERFRYIMVDEFQDTNTLQYELVKMLADSHQNLMVVGDDDQTIYSFNGAKSDIILNFDKIFSKVKTVTLDINYRSNVGIVGLGNDVIRTNKQRKSKILQATKQSHHVPQFFHPDTTDDEAKWIAEDIEAKVASGAYHYGDFAILHRTANNSRSMFEQLTLDELPFVHYSSVNQVFYEQWSVKPVIDHLRLSLNPRDLDAIESILPSLYINREKGIEFVRHQEAWTKKKYPLIHLQSFSRVKDFQKKKIEERIRLIKKLKEDQPVKAIRTIRDTFYDKFIEADEGQSLTMNKEVIKESLDELESSAKRFNTVSNFIAFIDDMIQKNEGMKNDRNDMSVDAVSLMTIHRAKGLEFPVVYVIGASEGILPHRSALEAGDMEDGVAWDQVTEALEEERRIAYVAITRAENELYIGSPAFYRGKKAAVSRFLCEAFGEPVQEKETDSRKTQNQRQPHHRRKDNHEKNKKVVAWVCTSSSCNGWQQITNHKETQIQEKECPICKSAMKQGEKWKA
ncbi:UvrD-helicase domain-containing protein [Tuberibacillus sp. Marseille-P3662]|uniref:UvrD-helicase domain-containing protein n=1 Tax=Tuberibacillus sp. Marseille-P3662 TaxID=1965358 RepID=UPI000A1CDEB1|nr:UvrD-helicase domain-containing protein [Tuberibacillus sp. Marseille-P3662]